MGSKPGFVAIHTQWPRINGNTIQITLKKFLKLKALRLDAQLSTLYFKQYELNEKAPLINPSIML